MKNRINNKQTSPFSPVVIDVHLGGAFFNTIVEKRGAVGWNMWKQSMAQMTPNPLIHSGQTDGMPPAFLLWLDFHGTDLSGRNLAGVDFSDVSLSRADFHSSSL